MDQGEQKTFAAIAREFTAQIAANAEPFSEEQKRVLGDELLKLGWTLTGIPLPENPCNWELLSLPLTKIDLAALERFQRKFCPSDSVPAAGGRLLRAALSESGLLMDKINARVKYLRSEGFESEKSLFEALEEIISRTLPNDAKGESSL